MSVYEEAKALAPYLSSLRREFHVHPCISREEFWTAERIEKELDAIGITDHIRVDGSGVYAVFHGEGEGERTITLRADIDALPIQEVNTDLPYCSREEGKMHACGHDGHTAALLGAAKLLFAHRSEFGGEVRLFFQHAEEIGYGAKQFVKAGLLGPSGRVFGIHMAPDLRCGTVGVKPGPNNASVDHFTIKVRGKAAHVSTPEQGADALYIASQIVVAAQALVTRRTSPVDPLIIGIGKLHAGTSYNIVAESAVLEGTTRAFSAGTRAKANAELDKLCKDIAALYGGSVEVEWEDFASPLVNPADICKEVSGVVTELFGANALVTDRPLSCGGDDFADYQAVVPGVYAFVGTSTPGRPDTCRPLHNDRFDLDEAALPIAAALHTEYALGYLTGAIG